MKRKAGSLSALRYKPDTAGFLPCMAFFICGAAAGVISAGYISDTAAQSLAKMLSGFPISEQDSVLSLFAGSVKYHVLAMFFGASLPGVFLLPVLAGVRGFFLSFTSAAAFNFVAGQSRTVFLVFYGLDNAVSLPCFFVVSVMAFSISKELLYAVLRGTKPAVTSRHWKRCFFCFALCLLVIFVFSVLELFLFKTVLA